VNRAALISVPSNVKMLGSAITLRHDIIDVLPDCPRGSRIRDQAGADVTVARAEYLAQQALGGDEGSADMLFMMRPRQECVRHPCAPGGRDVCESGGVA
jgi:hypothetical protein